MDANASVQVCWAPREQWKTGKEQAQVQNYEPEGQRSDRLRTWAGEFCIPFATNRIGGLCRNGICLDRAMNHIAIQS